MANLSIQDGVGSKVVALACKMVGGGTDGSLDLCARVCLIDQHENTVFHTFVKPQIPVTNYRSFFSFFFLAEVYLKHTYNFQHKWIPILNSKSWNFCRYETTGIRPEFLRDAMPVKQVQRKIQDFLCNGEPIWKIRSRGAKARILVGHGLDHDLDCLQIEYSIQTLR